MTSATIIIPARWGSTRFEGKPLTAELTGADGNTQTLIWWTYKAALKALPADRIWVATDDERISNAVSNFGGQSLMTDLNCRNGTERVQQAAQLLDLSQDEIIINFQGDAPLTPPSFVGSLIEAMSKSADCKVATPALRCDAKTFNRFKDQRKRGLVGGTTVVISSSGKALYFSKEVLPFSDKLLDGASPIPVFHHVGLYAYRRQALDMYVEMPLGALEQVEGLEQLRFLENDVPINCVEVDAEGRLFWEVNNPEDVSLVSANLRAD